MMPTTLAGVAFALGPTLLVPAGPGPQSVAVSLRPPKPHSLTVELEFRNLTNAPLDLPVSVELSLRGLDQSITGREPSLLVTSIDPATGQFGGHYADGSVVRLRLQAGQVRTIRVNLDTLKWSLGPNWVWRPRDLWEMAEAGSYGLLVDLAIMGPPDRVERIFAGPAKLRIVSQ